jgi:hypothetical protein
MEACRVGVVYCYSQRLEVRAVSFGSSLHVNRNSIAWHGFRGERNMQTERIQINGIGSLRRLCEYGTEKGQEDKCGNYPCFHTNHTYDERSS